MPPARRDLNVWLRVLRSVAVGGLLIAVYALMPFPDDARSTALAAALFVAGVVGLVAYVVVLVRRERDSNATAHGIRIESLLLFVYLVIVFFSVVYLRLADNGGFVGMDGRVDAFYFTVTTLATVGYGDIYATGQLARVATTVQMAFDIIFIGVGAKVLGSLVVDQRHRIAEERDTTDAAPGSA